MKTNNYKIPTDEIKRNPKHISLYLPPSLSFSLTLFLFLFLLSLSFLCHSHTRGEQNFDVLLCWFSYIRCAVVRQCVLCVCILYCAVVTAHLENLRQVCFLFPSTYSLNNKFQFAITVCCSTFRVLFDARFYIYIFGVLNFTFK